MNVDLLPLKGLKEGTWVISVGDAVANSFPPVLLAVEVRLSTQLVMPAQPAPGECRRKCK